MRDPRMTSTGKRRRGLAAGVLLSGLFLAGGCSFLFVSGPPPKSAHANYLTCTTGPWWPLVDVALTGLETVRTIYALNQPASAYQNNPYLTRGSDIGFGLGLTALFALSAIIGFDRVGQCDAAHVQLKRSVPLPPPPPSFLPGS